MSKNSLLLLACVLVSTGCRDEDPPPADAGAILGDGGAPLDCAGLLACAAGCPDDACADACVARTTPDGVSRASALVACAEREGCGDDSSCLEARCAAEIATCTGGAPSELDCEALLECAGACADDACADACVARATPEGVGEASALLECVEREGCGDDSSCIEARCPREVAACLDVPIEPGGDGGVPTDPFPVRIVGTTRDDTTALGRVLDSSSNGTTVFVRDDAAGEAAGYPIGIVAFYRLESITYRATLSGTSPGCTYSADFTETFTSPDPFETNLMIERAAGSDGLHGYGFAIGLDVLHPDGETIVCDLTGTTTDDFGASHRVVHGIDEPRTDLRTFTGTYVQGDGVRTMTWDLRAAD
ncbi:hypothetical protein [Sandaracinus amylolyticus]|uniref:hypothetical protein n=1 Tax=Sandaracinus amylolyticus TaxID=927083 RepID=UPI001F3DFE36|nr:hypothetical protein [Sandaracinus amylolyticus]UJR85573.1 Hypothetical protein I5071_76530 [Sandaracinus amylolyticus]